MLAKIVGILLIALGVLMAISVFQVSKALVVGGYGDAQDAIIKAVFLLVMAMLAMYMVKKGVDACLRKKDRPTEGDEARMSR